MSSTIFADESQFQIRYNGDFIEAIVFVESGGYNDIADLMYELDSNWIQAKQEAIQCYINLNGDGPDDVPFDGV